MFFISGITGQVGGAAARRLLKAGHTVRTLARDPAKAADWARQGVDVRRGDFADPVAVADALAGVDGAHLMLPPTLTPGPGFPEARAIIASFAAALASSPPPRLVVLSSIGSEQASGLGLITSTHLMERALSDLPFPTAFVRAGSFLENYGYAVGMAATAGSFPIFLAPTDRAVPMVATADVGGEVARLLVDGWAGKKVVELGSPVSPDDLAAAMARVLGRPVRAQAVPRNQWARGLQAMGMPAGSTGPYEEMIDGFNSGWIAFGVPGTEPVAGTTPADAIFERARPG